MTLCRFKVRRSASRKLQLCFAALAIGCTTAGALSGSSFEEAIKLTASDSAEGDRFGEAVATNGRFAVVGARLHDGPGLDAGAAYVFERDLGGSNGWGEAAQLLASDASTGDLFGAAVAVSRETVAVGAPFADGLTGAAYVFEQDRNGTGEWGEVVRLQAPDAAAGDEFGTSVAVSGDFIAVGAPLDSDAGFASGSTYLFERNLGGTDNWGLVTKLTASDAAVSDFFGWSVALDASTLIVGAERSNGNGADSGSAYLFERDQGGIDNWGEVVELTASDASGNDRFGYAVAIQRDVAVAGAYWNDAAGSNSGAAYLFGRNEGGVNAWGEIAKLTASDGGSSDWLGKSVGVSSDWVATGAEFDDDLADDAGAAYLFSIDSPIDFPRGNSSEDDKLLASDGAEQDAFGGAVAISGRTLVVGAREHDSPVPGAGTAYIFSSPPPTLTISGVCPGAATVEITDATANAQVALLRGSGIGQTVIASGGCQGTALDLEQVSVLWLGSSDETGTVVLQPTTPDSACSTPLQAIDLETCSASGVASFP